MNHIKQNHFFLNNSSSQSVLLLAYLKNAIETIFKFCQKHSQEIKRKILNVGLNLLHLQHFFSLQILFS